VFEGNNEKMSESIFIYLKFVEFQFDFIGCLEGFTRPMKIDLFPKRFIGGKLYSFLEELKPVLKESLETYTKELIKINQEQLSQQKINRDNEFSRELYLQNQLPLHKNFTESIDFLLEIQTILMKFDIEHIETLMRMTIQPHFLDKPVKCF
jgi:hypothetical protein